MVRWTSAIALAVLLAMPAAAHRLSVRSPHRVLRTLPPGIGNANGPIQASGSFASACIVQ